MLYSTVVILYLSALIAVGVYKARRVKTQEDFSLAGRTLSPFILFGTLLATWIGTGSIFGNAEETYRVGVAAFLLPLGGALGVVALYFLAGRARRSDSFTIQDILEARFGVGARIIGTITLVLAYLIIVSYQYRAGAAVLERLLPGEGMGAMSVVAVALFVILYTVLAGMYSVAYTDVANGIIMIVGIGGALLLLVGREGVGAAVGHLPADLRQPFGTYSALDLAAILLPPFLLILGDANMYQRFFSARDSGGARRATVYLIGGLVFLECSIIALAFLGRALLPGLESPAHVIVELAFNVLPPALGAILVSAILAVVISTADSYLLAPSTSVVRDVYHRFIRPDADPLTLVRVGRLVVMVLGLLALILSFQSNAFFRVALFAYTIYGVGVTPALLAALLWRGATRAGALTGMMVGVLCAVGWKIAGMEATSGVGAVVPSIILSCASIVLVSLATSRRGTNGQS